MTDAVMPDDVSAAVEHAHRTEWARVLAGVATRIGGNLDLAEDATADAFERALQSWRRDGVPRNPGAWLQTTAYRAAVDRMRRADTYERKLTELEAELDRTSSTPQSAVPDERLELIFCCCHPAFATEAQVALTLRCVAGLTVAEIAHAFLVPEQTMAKRLVRAKQKVRDAHVPLRVPERDQLADRLPAVLAVIYLIFNEGYAASGNVALIRTDLCARAIELGRLLVALLPEEPEVLGLLGLMLLHESRRAARTDSDGALVLLADQDRAKWDHALAAEAGRLINQAWRRPKCGPYVVQAAIAAVHASAAQYRDTDWPHIVRLYDLLCRLNPGPVTAMNRAIAIGMAEGADAGIAALDSLTEALDTYHYFHACRADLLRRTGQTTAAQAAYRRALGLARNPTEQRFLTRRLDELADPHHDPHDSTLTSPDT